MIENEFIYFKDETPEGRKTKIVLVMNRKGNFDLGVIKWHGPWRQYCFFPGNHMIFNKMCMNTIIEKVDELMAERRG